MRKAHQEVGGRGLSGPIRFGDPGYEDALWIQRYNRWRERFEDMSYEEHQAFYNEVEKAYPRQVQFTIDAFLTFMLNVVRNRYIKPVSVLEIGGWKGELANQFLRSQFGIMVDHWTNIEICPAVLGKQVCKDPRYTVAVPTTWFERTETPDVYDVFVASHTIEHMARWQFDEVLGHLQGLKRLKNIYLEAPLRETDTNRDWYGYRGAHILPIGWRQVLRMLDLRDWLPAMFDLKHGIYGGFKR